MVDLFRLCYYLSWKEVIELMVRNRTYGWVQNPSDFKKLKKVVQIFDAQSDQYALLRDGLVSELILFANLKNSLLEKLSNNIEVFSYTELVGTSKNSLGINAKNRAEAVADGLIQITVLPQSSNTSGKRWTDNWTSDGYLRWALSLGFVVHNRETDECSITGLGRSFSQSVTETQEKDILRKAILSYPPATQVLNILSEASEPVTKFYIGDKLGFKGEKGFTSYADNLMKEWFVSTADVKLQKSIKTDVEGTSDKYARMISTWLMKLGLVAKHNKNIETETGLRKGFIEYSITADGLHALKQSGGNSKNHRQQKYITWEFLAVDGQNRDYIRSRRAYILKIIQETKSIKVLNQRLKNLGFNDNESVIRNDLKGLNTIGVRIAFDDKAVYLKDNIVDFSIPELDVTKQLKDANFARRQARIMEITDLPSKYYELLEIAYDGSRNRDLEILTVDLFKNVYGFEGTLLGGSRKPDGIIYTSDFGVIIDTKAYSKGYSKSMHQEDEMVRYVQDNKDRDEELNPTLWWTNFDKSIPLTSFYFMWISSQFVGEFNQQIVEASQRTKVKGAAMNVEQLLIGADQIQKGTLTLEEFRKRLNNSEIIW